MTKTTDLPQMFQMFNEIEHLLDTNEQTINSILINGNLINGNELKVIILFHKLSENTHITKRIKYGLEKLNNSVEIHPDMRGGIPVLKGTRMPLSRILAELLDDAVISRRITKIAKDCELDDKQIREFVEALSILLDCPFLK